MKELLVILLIPVVTLTLVFGALEFFSRRKDKKMKLAFQNVNNATKE